jgi:hypothetical protein
MASARNQFYMTISNQINTTRYTERADLPEPGRAQGERIYGARRADDETTVARPGNAKTTGTGTGNAD